MLFDLDLKYLTPQLKFPAIFSKFVSLKYKNMGHNLSLAGVLKLIASRSYFFRYFLTKKNNIV